MSTLVKKTLNAIGIGSTDYSTVKSDERLVFFNTTGWLDKHRPVWNIPIHGWVFEPQGNFLLRKFVSEVLERKYQLTLNSQSRSIFKKRLDLFTVDNERRKRIVIELDGNLFGFPRTKPNGQFVGYLQIPVTDIDIDPNMGGILEYSAVLKPRDGRTFEGQIKLVPEQGTSVISDIDDTVKLSHITDRKKMFEAAFYKEFEAVEGMAKLYQRWEQQGADFHFVSSSPWQLYEPLVDFLQKSDFPWATLSLKKVRIKDETFLNLFKSGLKTKPVAIKAILRRYPSRQFILVGDSGEQDAQVYAQIAKEHPDQIRSIFIRNVLDDPALTAKYEDIFKGVDSNLWQVFSDPSEISLAI